jgi:16S rRNA (guanine966-N2)-methyltransferase
MRIIAGQYRRRKLMSNPGLTTRPITDFVKETLFGRLEDEIVGKKVADIFSGTGTIGFEALSRGATSVIFLENDPTAFELLKRNVAAIGVESNCLCWKTDIFRCSFRPKGDGPRFLPLDWIFFDPRLVLRTPARPEFQMPPMWELEKHWPFSRMEVFVYRKKQADFTPSESQSVARADEITSAERLEPVSKMDYEPEA